MEIHSAVTRTKVVRFYQNRLVMNNKTCPQCGNLKKRVYRKFCSQECYWESKGWFDAKNGNFCLECGNKITRNKTFCNNSCSAKYHNKNKENKVYGYCSECSKPIFEKGNKTFCSRNCYQINKTKELKAEFDINISENELSSFKSLYNHYQNNAKNRGICFDLKPKDFYKLIKGACYYCGLTPTQKHKMTENNFIIYNGVDRVNNEIGYEFDNCVSCCKDCNFAKGKMGKERFMDWLKRIKFLGDKK